MKFRAEASAVNKNGMKFTLRRAEGNNFPAKLTVGFFNKGYLIETFANLLEGVEDLEEGQEAINKFLAVELGSEVLGQELEKKVKAENCFLIDSKDLGVCWVFPAPGGYLSKIDGAWFYSPSETPSCEIKSTYDVKAVLSPKFRVACHTPESDTSDSIMKKAYEIVEGYEKEVKWREKQTARYHHGIPSEIRNALHHANSSFETARHLFVALFGTEAYEKCRNERKSEKHE